MTKPKNAGPAKLAFERWMASHMTADWRNPENCYSWKDMLKCWNAARKAPKGKP